MGRWVLSFGTIIFILLIGLPYLVVQVRAPAVGGGKQITPASYLPVSVYRYDTQTIVDLRMQDYLKGVVAAEMPAGFAMEALKTQAVIARTYLVAHMPVFGGEGCSPTTLQPGGGATNSQPNQDSGAGRVVDICDDPSTGQAWIDRDQMRQRWGALGYLRNWPRVSQAVEQTRGLIAVYDNQPIDAVYHAASGGRTETARYVWGREVPYLQSVPSPLEEGNRYWQNRVSFRLSVLAARLNLPVSELEDAVKRGEPPVEIRRRSPSGRALEVRVGNQAMDAKKFRKQLGLNSTWMEVGLQGENLVITTHGYGHGVGLSQYGADAMARRGKTAAEIIAHYYRGVTLRQLFAE